jgi:hypothetical protein
MTLVRVAGSDLYQFDLGSSAILFPLRPVFPKQLRRMLGANGSVAAAQIVGWTIEVASPADSFRMFGVQRDLGHGFIVFRAVDTGYDGSHRGAAGSVGVSRRLRSRHDKAGRVVETCNSVIVGAWRRRGDRKEAKFAEN